MSRDKRKTVFGVSDQVQPMMMARSLKFGNKEEEKLYYPYSENKGTVQLCSYCEADLCLCFHEQNAGFLMMWLIKCFHKHFILKYCKNLFSSSAGKYCPILKKHQISL